VPRLVGEIERLGAVPYLACAEARAKLGRLPLVHRYGEPPAESAEALNRTMAAILGSEDKVKVRFVSGDLAW
jgi:hypothetical protein